MDFAHGSWIAAGARSVARRPPDLQLVGACDGTVTAALKHAFDATRTALGDRGNGGGEFSLEETFS